MIDLLIRSGRVLDAATKHDAIADVAIANGKVVAIAPELNVSARQILEAHHHLVIPGLIDTHVHVCSRANGHVAHKMLSKAGVTTALDMAGPIQDVLATAAKYGAGLTIACVDLLAPDETLSSTNAPKIEVEQAIQNALELGAIGVKMHFDAALSPETKAHVIEVANTLHVHVASHSGSTATASDITGLREDLELAGKHRLHLAHINSYCRGFVKDALGETLEALTLLRGAPHLFSEAYLAVINTTSGHCDKGVPSNARVRGWLQAGGYAATEVGFAEAIHAGYAKVQMVQGDSVQLLSGEAGVTAWREAATEIPVSFDINPPSRTLFATSKNNEGVFDVKAIATDGGGFPRNDMAASGWKLVELGLLSPLEWIQKISWTPARVLGLETKGTLQEGSDADIAIFDPLRKQIKTTVAGGNIVMHGGLVFGKGCRILTTKQGLETVRALGCEAVLHDPARSGFYTGKGLEHA